jgi:putative oxidoreductase
LDWSILQRLFSTFANGWPGRGLLLLRLLTSAAVMHQALAAFHEASPSVPQTPEVIVAASAVLLLVGLWTPIAATLVAIAEVWIGLSRYFRQSGDPWYPLMLAALGVALAMLGPGAWSIDARLFGRKHIDLR